MFSFLFKPFIVVHFSTNSIGCNYILKKSKKEVIYYAYIYNSDKEVISIWIKLFKYLFENMLYYSMFIPRKNISNINDMKISKNRNVYRSNILSSNGILWIFRQVSYFTEM